MQFKNFLKTIPGAWYFLSGVLIAYLLLFLLRNDLFLANLNFSLKIILEILPVFLLVFILMATSNYFLTTPIIKKYLAQKGLTKWIFVILGGILSSGPIYMWYPFLADLKQKGLNDGMIACFLYNRAIKIPLLPVAILYFSGKYLLILSCVMICTSILQGLLINFLMQKKL